MIPKPVTSVRLPSLDGWRCVAIALVIVSHWPYSRGFPVSSWNERLVRSGDLGVRVFFVISGLLITYLLLTEADRRGRPSLQVFYVRRVLRIFPVYFLYIAVLAALTAIGLYSDSWSSWIGTLVYVWQQLFLSHFAGPRLAAFALYDWRIWWLAALACACISYYTVERPILTVRDRLRDRLFKTTAWIPQTPSIAAEHKVRQPGSLRPTPSGLVD